MILGLHCELRLLGQQTSKTPEEPGEKYGAFQSIDVGNDGMQHLLFRMHRDAPWIPWNWKLHKSMYWKIGSSLW